MATCIDQHRGPSGIVTIENTIGQHHRSFARTDLFHLGHCSMHNASIG